MQTIIIEAITGLDDTKKDGLAKCFAIFEITQDVVNHGFANCPPFLRWKMRHCEIKGTLEEAIDYQNMVRTIVPKEYR